MRPLPKQEHIVDKYQRIISLPLQSVGSSSLQRFSDPTEGVPLEAYTPSTLLSSSPLSRRVCALAHKLEPHRLSVNHQDVNTSSLHLSNSSEHFIFHICSPDTALEQAGDRWCPVLTFIIMSLIFYCSHFQSLCQLDCMHGGGRSEAYPPLCPEQSALPASNAFLSACLLNNSLSDV